MAGGVRRDGGHGLEAQGGNGGAVEGVFLGDGVAARDLGAIGGRGVRWGWGEEVVGCEPVVVGELVCGG
jgi:hypothetical protein